MYERRKADEVCNRFENILPAKQNRVKSWRYSWTSWPAFLPVNSHRSKTKISWITTSFVNKHKVWKFENNLNHLVTTTNVSVAQKKTVALVLWFKSFDPWTFEQHRSNAQRFHLHFNREGTWQIWKHLPAKFSKYELWFLTFHLWYSALSDSTLLEAFSDSSEWRQQYTHCDF